MRATTPLSKSAETCYSFWSVVVYDGMLEFLLQEAAPNDCGVLALRLLIEPAPSQATAQAKVECAALHCSRSMGIAWSSQSCQIPQCQILRQQPSDATRQQMVCAGCITTFTLPQQQ